jgi:hypothetical protein
MIWLALYLYIMGEHAASLDHIVVACYCAAGTGLYGDLQYHYASERVRR